MCWPAFLGRSCGGVTPRTPWSSRAVVGTLSTPSSHLTELVFQKVDGAEVWLLWHHVRAPSVVACLFSPCCVTSAVHHPLWRLPGRAGVHYVQTPSLRSGHRQCLVGRPCCPPFLDFRSILVTCRDLFLGECRCKRHLEPHLGLDALWGPFLKGCLVRTRTR